MSVAIMRGIPGSGKSTYIQNNYPGWVVRSADHYFISKEGEYKFRPEQLPQAHDDCLIKFLRHIREAIFNIVVDNTNISTWELSPYYRLAEIHSHDVEIVTVECEVDIALHRNIHKVPFATIQGMADRLEKEFIPPWWNHRVI